jgi:thioredoxin 1
MKTLLNKQDFDQFIEENAGKKVVIDVYADWCGPCKIMTPVFENVANEIGETTVFAKLNSDELGEELSKHSIRITTIPRFLVLEIDSSKKITLTQDLGGTQTKTSLVEGIQKNTTA